MIVAIIILALAIIVFFICFVVRVSEVSKQIDDLYHIVLSCEGEVEDLHQRCDVHYMDMAKMNSRIDELQSSTLAEVRERRERFSYYRMHGMDVKSAGVAVGVSYSTAKRYEQWRRDNKK